MNLCLNSLQAGIFNLRYLIIQPIDNDARFSVLNTKLQDLDSMSAKMLYSNGSLILFYGNDVLNRSSANSKQFYRVHQRRTQSKQATKLCFSGYPVPGINTGQGNYFYTVSGVLKTVFELVDSMENIKPLFSALEMLWMNSPNEGIDLPATMTYVITTDEQTTLPNPNLETAVHELLDPVLETIDQISRKSSDEEASQLLSELCDLLNGYRSLILQIGVRETKSVICHQESLVQALIQHDDHNMQVGERLLNETCGWVAEQFIGLYREVQDKSTSFKRKHISAIDNLPSDEATCEAIFPYCMRRLFTPWLINSHKDKDRGDKLSNERDTVDIFPFLLLILEFSNNALVSGVSHVIYPRLLGELKTNNTGI